MDEGANRQVSGGGRRGVWLALVAATLFGASTPFAKLIGGEVPPVLLAGLLYLGSGLGLGALIAVRRLRQSRRSEAPLQRTDLPWLGGSTLFGGILGPILLMVGLASTPASTSALLLNLEGVFTALLAWVVFRENVDRRIAMGMVLIVAGGTVLSWQGTPDTVFASGALAIVGAALCWAIDNNLTQKISSRDPMQVAAIKGGVAGVVNVAIGLTGAATLPSLGPASAAMVVGFLGYGVSLSLFVLALRHIGTARTGAYFGVAPFMGAGLALLLNNEPLTAALLSAGALMAAGVWLHLTERHRHAHTHLSVHHDHAHVHDDHHQHEHPADSAGGEHSHPHTHEPLTHEHEHFPDIHHRHGHVPPAAARDSSGVT